jgi:hypothetical protein
VDFFHFQDLVTADYSEIRFSCRWTTSIAPRRPPAGSNTWCTARTCSSSSKDGTAGWPIGSGSTTPTLRCEDRSPKVASGPVKLRCPCRRGRRRRRT